MMNHELAEAHADRCEAACDLCRWCSTHPDEVTNEDVTRLNAEADELDMDCVGCPIAIEIESEVRE